MPRLFPMFSKRIFEDKQSTTKPSAKESKEISSNQETVNLSREKLACGKILTADLDRIKFFPDTEKAVNEQNDAYSNFHKCIKEAVATENARKLK
jgi:hypothetical protein